MSCENEIVGGQVKRSKNVRSQNCRKVVNRHLFKIKSKGIIYLVVFLVACYFYEEFNEVDKHVFVYLRELFANFFDPL